MSGRAGLFPQPDRRDAELSDMYATPEYRVADGRRVRWTTSRTLDDCQECFARQHETEGASGSRFKSRQRRTLVIGSRSVVLRLCTAHAHAWRDRDVEDQE